MSRLLTTSGWALRNSVRTTSTAEGYCPFGHRVASSRKSLALPSTCNLLAQGSGTHAAPTAPCWNFWRDPLLAVGNTATLPPALGFSPWDLSQTRRSTSPVEPAPGEATF